MEAAVSGITMPSKLMSTVLCGWDVAAVIFFFSFSDFLCGRGNICKDRGSKTLPKFKTNKHLIRIPLPSNLDNPSTVHLGTNDKLDI